jgi:phosphoenolpyruvate carboxylase
VTSHTAETRRTQIFFAEKDQALREDVHRLGELVGQLVQEQCGESLYNLVEAARKTAIARREGDRVAETDLVRLLRGLDADVIRDFIRAFSTYFQMVNTAEKVHRIRRRRAYLRDPGQMQPGGFEAALEELKSHGIGAERVAELLGEILIQPVFTAHPTEPTRRTMLRKEQNIVRRLIELLDPSLTPHDQATAMARIQLEMTTGWQTEEHPSERMSVGDEAEHVLFFLTDVLYPVIPPFYEMLEESLNNAYPALAKRVRVPNLVRFASWVGGDMDGNPNVTAKQVRKTLARQRALILDLYYNECLRLAGKLSQSTQRVAVDDAVHGRIRDYSGHFPKAIHAVPKRHRDMPYRVLLRLIAARLQATYDDAAFPYESAQEFLADIRLIGASLKANKGAGGGLFAVQRLRRRIETFGFHMLTLDIRQNALVHRRVVGEALGEKGWLEASPEQRAARLRSALERRESPQQKLSSEGRRTLAVFQAIAYCRRKYGKRAIGPYIISMTHGPDDVLSVLLLARWGDLGSRSGTVPLDIVPLFETVEDLENGPHIMEQLLTDEHYAKHLRKRQLRQMIMVGYSDSNKDGGLASARWALQKSQASLVAVLDRANVELTLFHGRGGTISRGGGKTHAAVLATPPGAVRGRLRVTEQGEMINAKYGLRAIALRTLEQALGSVLSVSAARAPAHRDEARWYRIMDTIAEASREAYKNLVYDTPGFAAYFRAATPVDVIERMQIGSRPASRADGNDIEDLRAIPWVFAWTQARFSLPGWYGIGAGLARAVEEYGEDQVRRMLARWYFLRALLADVEMVLAKSDLDIAARYSALAGDLHPAVFPVIQAEWEQTIELILRLTGSRRLLENDATLRRAIRLRNPYVDPMSFLQIELLQRWRSGDRQQDGVFQALLASVNGIAHGLQNTG